MGSSPLESLDRDNHSSLLQKSVNYGRKKFYSEGQGNINGEKEE